MRETVAALVFSATLPFLGSAQEAVPPLFASHQALSLTIEADFDRIHKDRKEDSDYHPAIIRWEGADQTEQELEFQVKTRGRFRLKRSTCQDPPLRLNFPKSRVQGTFFEGQDKLKLVTHCRDRDTFEQNTLKEYLIYRTYNLLTDSSFRVRLARVTYVDSRGKDDPLVRYGFVIEDEDDLADRIGGKIIEIEQAHPSQLGSVDAARVAVFQYMIGNTDWSLVFFHNIKLMRTADGTYVPIPYDFDWSGLVNASYAEPAPELGTRSVRDRIYRGYCRPAVDFGLINEQFQENREAILNLFANQEGLSERTQGRAADYLEKFFEILDDPSKAEREIVGSCRTVLGRGPDS